MTRKDEFAQSAVERAARQTYSAGTACLWWGRALMILVAPAVVFTGSRDTLEDEIMLAAIWVAAAISFVGCAVLRAVARLIEHSGKSGNGA